MFCLENFCHMPALHAQVHSYSVGSIEAVSIRYPVSASATTSSGHMHMHMHMHSLF